MSIKKALLQTFKSVEEFEPFALLTPSTDPQATRISIQTPDESESRLREEQARQSIRRSIKLIEKPLKRWLSGGHSRHNARGTMPEANCLCHFLDDQSKISNIFLEALRKRDLPIVQALNSLSGQLGFEVFLAVLDKELVGSCQDAKPVSWYTGDHPIEEYLAEEQKRVNFRVLKHVFEKNYRIATLVGFDGNLVAENLRLTESGLLETDGFNAVKPKVNHDNDMDSLPDVTHLFSRTALVIVPQRSLLAFFQQTPERGFRNSPIKDPQSAAGFLAKASLRPQAPVDYSDNLLNYCRHIWDRRGMQCRRGTQNGISLSEKDDSDILYAALRLGKTGLFDQVLKEHHRLGQVPRGVIDGILKWLDFANRKSQSRFDQIKSRLDILIEGGTTLSLKVQILASFASPPMQENSSEGAAHPNVPGFVLAWIRESLQRILQLQTKACPLDFEQGRALADATAFFEKPDQFFATSVMPVLRGNCQTPKFLLGASTSFHEMHQKFATGPAGELMAEHSQIAAGLLISETNFAHLVSLRAYRENPVCFTIGELEKAFTLFCRASSSEKDLAVSFITKLATDLPGAPIERLLDLWIPFLQDLIKLLRSNRLPLNSPPCQKLYKTVFVRLINEYVGEESSTGAIPSGARVKCDCGPCRDLNAFLADSEAKKCGFKALGRRTRQHVKRQLQEAGIPCSCETVVPKPTLKILVVTKTSVQAARYGQSLSSRKEEMLRIFNKFFPSDLKKLLGSDYATIHNMKPILETSDPMPGSEGGSNAVGKDDALEANLSSPDNDEPSSRKTTLRATSDASASGRKKGYPKASGSNPENATSSKRRATDDASLTSSTAEKKRKRGCAKHENCVFAALFGPDVPH